MSDDRRVSDRQDDRQDERGTGWRPVPDPTTLTTEALQREIGNLRELFEIQLASLTELMNEKFHRVEQKFDLVENQRVEQKADAKEALAAALQAAEKAVGEQTTAATKSTDALSERVDTALKGVGDTLGGLTGRVTVMEAIKLGTQERTNGFSNVTGLLIGFGALIVSLVIYLGG